MLEAALEQRCCKYAKKVGCWALKLWPTVTGLPDRLVLMPGGRVWFVEFKAPQGRISKRQVVVMSLLLDMGFRVTVVRDFKSFAEGLDRLPL